MEVEERITDDAPDPRSSLITCRYSGGKPLGITFEWFDDDRRLLVDDAGIEIGSQDGTMGNELMKGDILVSVNGIIVKEFSFDEVVGLLRSLESQERILSFERKELQDSELPELDLEENERDGDDGDEMILSNSHNPNDLAQFSSSSVHQKLAQIFSPSSPTSSSSSTRLSILHCNIINLSYWYRSRKALTSRKQSAFIIQQNPQHMRFDSSLYILKVDPKDGEIKPMKKFLSSHPTRWAAYRHIETKMKERDANPFLGRGSTSQQQQALSTHFRIQIVSETFYHLNIYERLGLVYEHLLLHGYGKQYGPWLTGHHHYPRNSPQSPSTSSSSSYCTFKHISYVGSNVQNLPFFRFLDINDTPLHLLIETWTPSQWKPQLYPPPLSERYGSSHNQFKSQHIDQVVKLKEQKKRIKILLMTTSQPPPSSSTSSSSHPHLQHEQYLQESSFPPPLAGVAAAGAAGAGAAAGAGGGAGAAGGGGAAGGATAAAGDLLGLDSEILFKQFHKKTGGVYSHFFKDLSPGVKHMVLSRYLMNKQLIQKEGNRMKEKHSRRKNIHQNISSTSTSTTPITTMSILKAKLSTSKYLSDYDSGTENENQMIEEIFLYSKKIEKYIIFIQRIYRQKLFSKIQKLYFLKQYNIILIQKVIRGRYGRLYFKLLQKIQPLAVRRIIDVYRHYIQKKRMKIWYDLIYKAIKIISPILKKFVKKCIFLWFEKYFKACQKIQSVIRMYLGKIKYYQKYGQHFLKYCSKIIIKIQSFYRGYKIRLKILQKIEKYLIEKIDEPAVVTIQRIYRGKIGKKIFQQKKLENISSIIIQKYFLRWYAQLYYLKLKKMMLEKYCAIQIQRIYRGRLDREIIFYLKNEKYYENIYLPIVIQVQAIIRGYVIRKKIKILKKQHFASIKIQNFRRIYLAKKKYNEKLLNQEKKRQGQYAVKIQTMIRSFLAQKKYKYLLYQLVGKRIFAAKIIIRAWKNFTHYRRYDVLFTEHLQQLQQKKILKLFLLKQEIVKDLKEISEDILTTKTLETKFSSRIIILNHFLIESEMRISELETLLLTVSMEDIQHGWGESYNLEYEMLVFQKKMAYEECRLRKRELNQLQEELFELYFEYEDMELELDHVTSGEIESYEKLRQSEIAVINKRVKRLREREIRIERCKWKVKSSRQKVIQRNRGYFLGIREKVRHHFLSLLPLILPLSLSLSVSLPLCLSL
jgi:hypothetical protein